MSNIYKITNENGEDELLVSKDYVDLRFKALQEALKSVGANLDDTQSDHSVSPMDNVNVIDITNEVNNSKVDTAIDVEDIPQDAKHRFITDEDYKDMKSKASVFEMNAAVDGAKKDLEKVIDDQYIRLLNVPDALSKFRQVAELINTDSNLESLLNTMGDKVSKKELEDHTSNQIHLTNEDRAALNILLEKFNDGTLDLVGKSADQANNAVHAEDTDKINGLNLNEAQKNRLEIFVIGNTNTDKFETSCDLLIDPQENCENKLEDALEDLSGRVGVHNGVYNFNTLDISFPLLSDQELFITGSGLGTIFKCSVFEYGGNRNLEYLTISSNNSKEQANIFCDNHSSFHNVRFENCNIILDSSRFVTFDNCYFKHCDLGFMHMTDNIRILNSYFEKTAIPKYIASNCYFNGNFTI